MDEVLSVGDYVFQQKCLARMKEIISEGAAVLFVSHNLKSLAEFCQRCLLLDRGRIIDNGPTRRVIASYLNPLQAGSREESGVSSVKITKFALRDEHGECIQFRSGQKAWVDVEVTAYAPSAKLSLCLFLKDGNFQDISDTSTERLGHGSFSLNSGETFTCTFELDINMASGTFHLATLVYRYDTQTRIALRDPAATLYVTTDTDVRGSVNCFPKVIRHEIVRSSEEQPSLVSGTK